MHGDVVEVAPSGGAVAAENGAQRLILAVVADDRVEVPAVRIAAGVIVHGDPAGDRHAFAVVSGWPAASTRSTSQVCCVERHAVRIAPTLVVEVRDDLVPIVD